MDVHGREVWHRYLAQLRSTGIAPGGAAATPGAVEMIDSLLADGSLAGGGKTLSAGFIRWLLHDDAFLRAIPARQLSFGALVVSGHLDLRGIETSLMLAFRDCEFDGGVNLSAARLKGLDVSGSSTAWIYAPTIRIEGDFVGFGLCAGPLVLEDGHIKGSLRLSGATLKADPGLQVAVEPDSRRPIVPRSAALAADRLRVDGKIELNALRRQTTAVPFTSHGAAFLRSAHVGGIVDCQGARFLGDAAAQPGDREIESIAADSIEVDGPIYLTSYDGANSAPPLPFEARGLVDLSESDVDGSIWIGWATQREPDEVAASSAAVPGGGARPPDGRLAALGAGASTPLRGAIDMSRSKISGNVNLIAAEIDGGVRLANASIVGSIQILASTLRSKRDLKARCAALSLDGARVGDTLFLTASRFEGLVSAIEAQIVCELMVSGCSLSAGMGDGAGVALSARGIKAGYVHFKGGNGVGRQGATAIEGRVNFAQARIDSNFRLDGTTHTWSVHGPDSTRALITLDTAQIGGELDVAPQRIEAPGAEIAAASVSSTAIHGRGLTVGRDVRIGPSPARGAAAQPSTGDVIAGPIVITNAHLGGDVTLRGTSFAAVGASPLDLSGSTIAGNLKIRGCRLDRSNPAPVPKAYSGTDTKALAARDCEIKGSLTIDDSCVFRGGIDLGGSHVAGDVQIDGADLQPPASSSGVGMRAMHIAALERGEFHVLNLARAVIGGDWRWGPMPDVGAATSGAGDPPRGIVNLGNAQIGRICPSPAWQPQWVPAGEVPSYLRLAGCTYAQIGERSLDSIDWRRWLALQDPGRFAVQPYEQLGRTLRAMGRHDIADTIARQKLREIRVHKGQGAWGRSTDPLVSLRRAERIRARLRTEPVKMRARLAGSDPFGSDLRPIAIALTAALILWSLSMAALMPHQVDPGWLPIAWLRALWQAAADRLINPLWTNRHALLDAVAVAGLVMLVLLAIRRFAWVRISRFWGSLLDHGIGYGYRPMRAVAASILVVITGAFVYSHADTAGYLRPVDARRFDPTWAAGEVRLAVTRPGPPENYPKLNPVLYSFEQFVPFVAMKHVQYWEIDGAGPPWLHAYKALHILLGYVLGTAIALSPITIFRKD